MEKKAEEIGNGVYAFQLNGRTIEVRLKDKKKIEREADDDMKRCENRSTRVSQAKGIRGRLFKEILPATAGYSLSEEDKRLARSC